VDKLTLPQVDEYLLTYVHKATDILLRMAVLRQQQIIRALTLEQEEARARLTGQYNDVTGAHVEDLRSIGGQLYNRHHRGVDALAEIENELLAMRARYGTPHPPRWR